MVKETPTIDMGKCPSGGCDLKEYRSHGWPYGMRYGCLGAKQAGAESGAFWVPEWSAWVCAAAYLARRRMEIEKTLPQVDPVMVDHTRLVRASFRPHWMPPEVR